MREPQNGRLARVHCAALCFQVGKTSDKAYKSCFAAYMTGPFFPVVALLVTCRHFPGARHCERWDAAGRPALSNWICNGLAAPLHPNLAMPCHRIVCVSL